MNIEQGMSNFEGNQGNHMGLPLRLGASNPVLPEQLAKA